MKQVLPRFARLPGTVTATLRRAPGGPTLHRWQLGQLLAEGRWTRVLEARPLEGDERLPPAYALKTLREDVPAVSIAIAGLRRHAQAGARLSCPHLAPVLVAHLHTPPHYLLMPLLEGASLRRHLAARGPAFGLAETLWIVRQIALGLQNLHEAGWLHGDLKPENIFLSPAGHATLLDFGLARQRNTPECVSTGRWTGTLAYAAPETILPDQPLTPAMDIYGLGVVLYELLTGQLPFAHANPEDMAAAHLTALAPDIVPLRSEISPRLARLVRKMLSKEALRRPTTDELLPWLTELEIEHFAARSA
jgi:serine/threonine-protein kinase